ncbi:MAG: hypothetical protein ABEI86_12835, partial [Halobacteriaceae archaeon]
MTISTTIISSYIYDYDSGNIDIDYYPLRELALIFFLSVSIVFGAYAINVSNSAIIVLLVLVFVAFIPILSVTISASRKVILLLGTAFALLYQDALLVTGMTGGDQPMEYYLANITLTNGYWDPEIALHHYELLRISLLHPAMKELTGLSLYWSMKLLTPVYPLLLVPVVYAITREKLSEQAAYFGSFIYISFFPFFTRLSRDGRSGMAIFFSAVLILSLLDSSLSRKQSFIYGGIASIGLSLSHEGIAVIAFGIIVGASLISGKRIGLSIAVIGGISAFLLYAYTTDAVMFELIVGVFMTILSRIESFGIGSSAAQAVRASNYSYTVVFIKIYFITITITAGIGILLHRVRSFIDKTKITLWDGLLFFTLLFLLATFAPVSIMGIQRSIMIGMIPVVGYVYYAIKYTSLKFVPDNSVI